MWGKIVEISKEYFDYMAKNYPVMCLSDEFYFFPRVKKAAGFLNLLDSLNEDKIKESIFYIKKLKSSLEKLNFKDVDLEAKIDITLLRQSTSSFLREFDEIKIWSIDPSIYLKLLLLGIDQIVTRFSLIKTDIDDILLSRMAEIPRLLNEAKNNLRKPPLRYLEVAREMVNASIEYFRNNTFPLRNKSSLKEKDLLTKNVLESLKDFKRFLLKTPCQRSPFLKDRALLEGILKNSFSYNRGLEEIFDIASREYHHTLEMLKETAKRIKNKERWQKILSSYTIEPKDAKELIALYSSQIEKLRNFFRQKEILSIPPGQDIKVMLTPQYMRPFRASASYSSPATDNSREPAYFYITAFNSIHNEYIFVTAHETYPGHHLLDSARRRIRNPVRAQIESPLFYEGWASYAERLIDELGYIKDPIQTLIGLKRQAWRAVRAMLDAGIRINRLKLTDGERMLRELGYGEKIVKSMLRHYGLSPGYQLCYTMGKFELDRLKERFSSKLNLKRFHDLILQGGQMPFHLAEEYLKGQLCKKDS